jgi:hypothetical protein
MKNSCIRNWFIALFLIAAAPLYVLAQYGGGTGGAGTGSTGGVYQAPKGGYSSSTGIAIGAAAAAGVAIAYFAFHNRRTVTGCVESSSGADKLTLVNGGTTYILDSGSLNLTAGDRVKLLGRKEKSGSEARSFHVRKLVKDYGACHEDASAHRGSQGGPGKGSLLR